MENKQTNSKTFVFDLDGTLTPSKSCIKGEMVDLVCKLLVKYKVGVTTGGKFFQLKTQFLDKLPCKEKFKNLYLLPLSGGTFYKFNQSRWKAIYKKQLTRREKKKIREGIKKSIDEWKVDLPEKAYGERIEDRDTQITFSALGQNAPLKLKKSWDSDYKKREDFVKILKKYIPEFDINIGGTTSVDITQKNINKAYGINKLAEYLNIPVSKVLFIGDALQEGGNDATVKTLDIETIKIKGPKQTKKIIKKWV